MKAYFGKEIFSKLEKVMYKNYPDDEEAGEMSVPIGKLDEASKLFMDTITNFRPKTKRKTLSLKKEAKKLEGKIRYAVASKDYPKLRRLHGRLARIYEGLSPETDEIFRVSKAGELNKIADGKECETWLSRLRREKDL